MKLLIIGETCTDVFIYGECTRLNPEAPVPVFKPVRTVGNSGMAGNVSANVFGLGVSAFLQAQPLWENDPVKTRYVDERSDQQLLRVDQNDEVRPLEHPITRQDMAAYAGVIISDYDKGFLSNADILNICLQAGDKPVFIDTKKDFIDPSIVESCTALKINQKEFAESNLDPEEDWESLIVTQGEQGAVWRGRRYPVEHPVEVRDVAGAGDTFLAALAVRYIETQDMEEAIRFANRCAAWVVSQRGVTVINRQVVDG